MFNFFSRACKDKGGGGALVYKRNGILVAGFNKKTASMRPIYNLNMQR